MIVTDEKGILEKLKTLRYKDDSVTLTNVYPAILESMFNFDNEIRIIGGRDLDYEGETNEYIVSGSAYYGTCEFVKKHGDSRPNVEMNCATEVPKQENKYTRTSFEFKDRIINNVPPAILCTDGMLNGLRTLEYRSDSSFKLYYIGFSCYGITELHPFYAKNEIDVRRRALSIWGRYDSIFTKAEIENIKENYEHFDKYYTINEKVYVLTDKGEM